MAEVTDLGKVARLLSWDQQTMMPPAGTGHRADQFADAARRIAHELLHRSRGRCASRRAYARSRSRSIRLRRRRADSRSRAATTRRRCTCRRRCGRRWRRALAAGASWSGSRPRPSPNFELFLPSLERIVELKLQYVDCVADGAAERVRRPARRLRAADDDRRGARRSSTSSSRSSCQLIAELREREVDDSFLDRRLPVEPPGARSRTRWSSCSATGPTRWRHRPHRASVRVGAGRRRRPDHDELRPDDAEVALLDDARVRPRPLHRTSCREQLERLPTGSACSLGIHESQSRLWENSRRT